MKYLIVGIFGVLMAFNIGAFAADKGAYSQEAEGDDSADYLVALAKCANAPDPEKCLKDATEEKEGGAK